MRQHYSKVFASQFNLRYDKMPSVQHFIAVNSSLITIGTICYTIYTYTPHLLVLFFIVQDLLMPRVLLYFRNADLPFSLNMAELLTVSVMNTCSLVAAASISSPHTSIATELLLFVPLGFAFEVVFDFFHYWIHRGSHSIPLIYKHTHAKHHLTRTVNVYTTFQHNAIDLVCTNLIPVFLTTCLLRPSQLFLCLWFPYKIIQEMYGHMGIPTHTSSFPQCVWLPRLCGIEMYNSDHALHHKFPHKNFSKRFTLWDKVFRTYAAPGETFRRDQ